MAAQWCIDCNDGEWTISFRTPDLSTAEHGYNTFALARQAAMVSLRKRRSEINKGLQHLRTLTETQALNVK